MARAVHSVAIDTREPVVTGVGLQMMLPFIGTRSDFANHEIMEMLEVLHALGNSYRLASSGIGLGVVYARFTLGYCRAIIAVSPGALRSLLETVGAARSGMGTHFTRRNLSVLCEGQTLNQWGFEPWCAHQAVTVRLALSKMELAEGSRLFGIAIPERSTKTAAA